MVSNENLVQVRNGFQVLKVFKQIIDISFVCILPIVFAIIIDAVINY